MSYNPPEEKGKVVDLINQSTDDIVQLFEFYAGLYQTEWNDDKKYKVRIYIEDMDEVEGK